MRPKLLTAAVNRGNERVLIEGSNAEIDRMNVWIPGEGAWTRAKTFDSANILELFLFVPSFLFFPLVWNWN